jgi:hypothetical protein
MSSPLPTISDFGGTVSTLLRYPDESDPKWSAFNPSIARHPDGSLHMVLRSSNYYFAVDGVFKLTVGGYIENRTWMCVVDETTLKVKGLKEIKYAPTDLVEIQRGPEDARLFWRDGSWWFTAVLHEPPSITQARLGLFRLTGDVAELVEVLPAASPLLPEKNWMMPDVAAKTFDFVYSPSQVVKNGKIVGAPINMARSVDEDRYHSHIRGSSQLVLQADGTYLAVAHDVYMDKQQIFNPKTFGWIQANRQYRHFLARYSSEGELIELSPPFIFKRLGIEFAAGMVESGDDLLISYGGVDTHAVIARVPKTALVNTLRPYHLTQGEPATRVA